MKKIIFLMISTVLSANLTTVNPCDDIKNRVQEASESLNRIDNDLYMLSVLEDLHNDMVTVVTQCTVSQSEYTEYHLAMNEAMEMIVVLKTITK